jgi:hypothetical protein
MLIVFNSHKELQISLFKKTKTDITIKKREQKQKPNGSNHITKGTKYPAGGFHNILCNSDNNPEVRYNIVILCL